MPYHDTWPFLSGGAGPGCAYFARSPLHEAHIVSAGAVPPLLEPRPTRAHAAGHPERSATHSNLHSTTHRVAASFNGSFPHSQYPRVPIRQPLECGNNPYSLYAIASGNINDLETSHYERERRVTPRRRKRSAVESKIEKASADVLARLVFDLCSLGDENKAFVEARLEATS